MYDDRVQFAVDLAFQYALFVAQGVTIWLLVVLGFAWVLRLSRKNRGRRGAHLEVVSLNERFERQALSLAKACLSKSDYKNRKRRFKELKSELKKRPRTFVLDFKGDLKASGAQRLAAEVSGILNLADPQDEVLVKIESPGGAVAGYGLAASQLKRLRDKGLKLTAAVDQVAASGGYLMASVADHILAAPFAVVGSIGVVASLPNFKRLLDAKQIDFEQVTAGEHKRSLSLFGENTEKGRAKVQEEVDAAHQLFKDWVLQGRPQIKLEQVATGEWWHAGAALELGLVDELGTSDEYLRRQAATRQLLALQLIQPKAAGKGFSRWASLGAALFKENETPNW
ncbi:MAG: protease SohB [bacterium]|nr:protease SohB [bacterium]